MTPSTLSGRIKQNNSTNKDVAAITEQLSSSLNITDEPTDHSDNPENDDEEDDWEKLADKELETPVEPIKPPITSSPNPSILELYGFDPRIQMHQLVKDFTRIVDPTGTMPFRPKMVNQSLLLTFNNPKHATAVLYNYSCVTPMDPVGKLRRSDGNIPLSRTSTNSLPPAPASPSRVRCTSPSSRPLTTDTVARRFIAGHLGIRATSSPERREFDKLVRTQATQQKLERERQKEKEKEEKKRQEEELKNVWEQG